jgi:hypothetical protein
VADICPANLHPLDSAAMRPWCRASAIQNVFENQGSLAALVLDLPFLILSAGTGLAVCAMRETC